MENLNINQPLAWQAEIDPILLKINRHYEEEYRGFKFEVNLSNSLYNKNYSASIKMGTVNNPNVSSTEIYKDSSSSLSKIEGEEINEYIDNIYKKIIKELNNTKAIIDSCLRGTELEGYTSIKIDPSTFVVSDELPPAMMEEKSVKPRKRKAAI